MSPARRPSATSERTQQPQASAETPPEALPLPEAEAAVSGGARPWHLKSGVEVLRAVHLSAEAIEKPALD